MANEPNLPVGIPKPPPPLRPSRTAGPSTQQAGVNLPAPLGPSTGHPERPEPLTTEQTATKPERPEQAEQAQPPEPPAPQPPIPPVQPQRSDKPNPAEQPDQPPGEHDGDGGDGSHSQSGHGYIQPSAMFSINRDGWLVFPPNVTIPMSMGLTRSPDPANPRRTILRIVVPLTFEDLPDPQPRRATTSTESESSTGPYTHHLLRSIEGVRVHIPFPPDRNNDDTLARGSQSLPIEDLPVWSAIETMPAPLMPSPQGFNPPPGSRRTGSRGARPERGGGDQGRGDGGRGDRGRGTMTPGSRGGRGGGVQTRFGIPSAGGTCFAGTAVQLIFDGPLQDILTGERFGLETMSVELGQSLARLLGSMRNRDAAGARQHVGALARWYRVEIAGRRPEERTEEPANKFFTRLLLL